MDAVSALRISPLTGGGAEPAFCSPGKVANSCKSKPKGDLGYGKVCIAQQICSRFPADLVIEILERVALIGQATLQNPWAHPQRAGNCLQRQVRAGKTDRDLLAHQTGHTDCLSPIRDAPLRKLDQGCEQRRIMLRQRAFRQFDGEAECVLGRLEDNGWPEHLAVLAQVRRTRAGELELGLTHDLGAEGGRQPERKRCGDPVNQMVLQHNSR